MTEYVTDVCPSCGNLVSVCSDPEVRPYPQRSVCYFTAGREQTWRRTIAKYGQPDPKDASPHEIDGLAWGMSLHDLTPDDDFFGDAPLLDSARGEQSDREQGETS